MKSKLSPNKKITIIGAGPGGLAASLILAHRGYNVTIFEASDRVGGRSSKITIKDFNFDSGPTFFIYRKVIDSIFSLIGKKLEDYVTLTPIEPLYDLIFQDKVFRPYVDHLAMMKEIHRVFPGEEKGYQRYLKGEEKRLNKITPILQMPFLSPLQYLHPRVLGALNEIDIGKSLYQRLKKYFVSDELIYSMAFQAKYLGMSPWDCPSLFSILSYMEHQFGVYHIQGGLYHLNEAMAKLATSMGVTIHLNSAVTKFIVEKKRVTKIKVKQKILAVDDVILNGDFAKNITLIDEKHRRAYRDAKLNKLDYSCSTFNLYFGLDKVFPLAHHTIIFSKDYRSYVDSLTKTLTLSDDPSFYIHNPSGIDPSYAPAGHSSVYVLVPVPNLKANINWTTLKDQYRKKIIALIIKRTGIKDFAKHIVAEHIISPQDWQDQYHVHLGANFNLAHNMKQLLFMRPHNRFNNIHNLYLVGGGTHPGSGLPTIYQSAILAADLISQRE